MKKYIIITTAILSIIAVIYFATRKEKELPKDKSTRTETTILVAPPGEGPKFMHAIKFKFDSTRIDYDTVNMKKSKVHYQDSIYFIEIAYDTLYADSIKHVPKLNANGSVRFKHDTTVVLNKRFLLFDFNKYCQ